MAALSINLSSGLWLRMRLIRRYFYRLRRAIVTAHVRLFIKDVLWLHPDSSTSTVPVILLTSFQRLLDFWVLAYIFKDRELVFIALERLPDSKIINSIKKHNHMLYLSKPGYSFFKRIMESLRNFNRSLVLSPEASEFYAGLPMDPRVVVRIATMANVPILPVAIDWEKCRSGEKCVVTVGKSTYISPRSEEFRDIFFKKRVPRKFSRLPPEDLSEIGRRIISKLNNLRRQHNGPNL